MCATARKTGLHRPILRSTQTLRFADFTLDLQRRQLTRGGKRVDLSPGLLAILGYLASHPGTVFAKDALFDRFWPGVVVSENTLERSVARIRKALGDSIKDPKFIQNLARRGYCFIARVELDNMPLTGDALDKWVAGRLVLEALDAVRLDEAVRAFEQVLAANPEDPEANAGVANGYFLQFERTRADTPDWSLLERAIAHARQACLLKPSLAEGWATLGYLLTSTGKVTESREAALRATKLEPKVWMHHFRLAYACWGDQRIRAVIGTLALMPGFAPARLLQSMVFVARCAFEEARESAAQGARTQSRLKDDHSAFPPFGLHWLLGLLHLHNGDLKEALASFRLEIDEGRPTTIYYRELHVQSLIGIGYAQLANRKRTAAVDAFREALVVLPSSGRALVGLARACPEDRTLPQQIMSEIDRLKSVGRPAEAAFVLAGVHATAGDVSKSCAVLMDLLQHAPPGPTGWMIPIDPALAQLAGRDLFDSVLEKLAARAR